LTRSAARRCSRLCGERATFESPSRKTQSTRSPRALPVRGAWPNIVRCRTKARIAGRRCRRAGIIIRKTWITAAAAFTAASSCALAQSPNDGPKYPNMESHKQYKDVRNLDHNNPSPRYAATATNSHTRTYAISIITIPRRAIRPRARPAPRSARVSAAKPATRSMQRSAAPPAETMARF
jgi:hypothetical protein